MKSSHFSYTRIIAFGFLALILVGAGLLCLPAATRDGVATPFVDALFTSTSATCVTGLIVFDTFTYWSVFGQIVIITLIQIGGLGFMTVVTLFSMLMRRNIGLRERKLLMQTAGSIELRGIVRLIRRILLGTQLFEGAGSVLLAIRFVGDFGWGMGIYKAVFTSISAFCNAGFDLMGGYASLTAYAGDPLVILTVSALILIGGIGFLVWNDVAQKRFAFGRYLLHTKIVLAASAVLVVGGTLLFLLLENGSTLAGRPFGEQLLGALFLAVTPRTAGFASVDYAALSEAGHFATILFMFVGGAPGSTAGGVKITTLVVLLTDAAASARQSRQIVVFKRRLDETLVKQAVAVVTIYLFLVSVGTLMICAFQPFAFKDVLFEAFSAASTVGLTTGITGALSAASQLVIIFLMYGGRVGGLTLALVLAERRVVPPVDRPSEKILVG